MPPIVTLLTDFGLSDPFVGVMKGVLAGDAPELGVIDLTHGIAPGRIEEGAFWLERSFRYFPAGTVHCAVVDPGVGSARGALVLAAEGHWFVGPDNGLLAEVASRAPGYEARAIDQRVLALPEPSRTFHGRDLFVRVAARLATGALAFETIGPLVERLVPSPLRAPARNGSAFAGSIVTVDHFGNLLTNLRPAELLGSVERGFELEVAGRRLRRVSHYAAAQPGELAAILASFDVVEIAARGGSAAAALGVGRGESVVLIPT